MTDQYAHSASLPQFLRRRMPLDVPEDVADDDVMAHLNDPNWDLNSVRTSRSSVSFELDEKHEKKKSFGGDSFDFSSRASVTDTESNLGTTTRGPDSQAPLHAEFNDESPYPEVRASVSNTDDPLMPCNTFRMWFLGVLVAIVVPGLNQVFSMRYPSVWITGLVVQLAALPMGRFLEMVLPTKRFRTFGYTWSLNPGPFTIKEHTVVTVMANVVVGGAYGTDVVATQRVFYDQNWGTGYAIVLCISSQLIGYSFAGFTRRFLVWPASMIWPGALVNAALFNTLHKSYGKRERNHMPRERFFLIVLACSFAWYWVPAYLFQAVSVFNWVCWAAPNNVVVNQLFGTISGLGMSAITLDWSMISFIGSPLVTPWWAEMNIFVSFVLWFWIITPIIYYRNVFYSKFFPISSYQSFDNTAMPYDTTRILTDGRFDLEKYQAYSPLFLSSTFALSYGISFAAFTAVLTHTFLWYRHDIMRQLRRRVNLEKDVHSRLMTAYPEVPHYWYGILFLFAFALGIVAIENWPTGLPFWAYLISFIFPALLIVPCGIVLAITNQQVPLHIMAELLIGYMLPGRPTAMMVFKTYGYLTTYQATSFVGDLKLGHYMKVPPRIMFLSQIIATVIACIVSVFVQEWMFANITDMCSPDQKDGFICLGANTFHTASLVWGSIGPARMFSKGSLYYPLIFFFIIGALAPIPFYFLARRWPHAFWRYVNMPVFLNGVAQIPPASGINYASWFLTGAVFQWFVRRFHFRWWMRFNYILSAGLDAGVALGMVVVFFCVLYPTGGKTLKWWGNEVFMNTLDAMGVPGLTLAEGDIIGPKTWN